jgi:hypothetical protein
MRKAVEVILVFTLFFPLKGFSQADSSDLFERTTERVSELSPEPVDFSDLTDNLHRLEDHPVNLNRATREELEKLSFLDEDQVRSLLAYQQTYGAIYSIYELMAVKGFDSAMIMKIKPYIRIGPEPEMHPLKPGEVLKKGRASLLLRYEQVLQKQAGYEATDSSLLANQNAGYLGSPLRLMFRFTWSYYDRLLAGISGEKDPGEQFFRGSQKNGMDFYSGFISLQNTGILRQLTIGNFNADFGQGLTLSSGITSGAIPGTGNMRRCAGGIRPSQSLNEGNYLRGIAVVLKKAGFRLTGFFSDHRRDATSFVMDTASGEGSHFSSFNETGYHRLPKEILNRNAVREMLYGGNLNFRNTFLSIGFTGFRSQWSASTEPLVHPYSLFTFHGKENLNLGIDFQFLWKDIFLFGEVSRSRNSGMALLSGIQVNANPGLQFSVSVRDYQRNYQDLLSNAIGQNSSNANEEGILVAFSAAVARRLGLSGYLDLYRYPWLKYRNDNPSEGKEFGLQADLTPGRSVGMYLRGRYRSGQINGTGMARMVNVPVRVSSTALRYHVTWQVSGAVVLKSRFEWLRNRTGDNKPQTGYLFSQDLSCKLVRRKMTATFLYALFDTDSYNERIYAYESDVPYGYSVPAYSGKGIRCLLLAGWDPWRFLDLWVRYAHTWYADRNSIGTGPEQISGDTKSELEIQVRFRF